MQLYNGSDPSGGNGITNWDSHSNIHKTHAMQAEIMDQPTAALISDMKRRGLLKNTWWFGAQSLAECHSCRAMEPVEIITPMRLPVSSRVPE